MNDNGGIQMAWLTIVIGIVVGYMIYQKKQQSSQSEFDQDTNETNSYSFTARSMQNDLYQGTGSADEKREINEAVVAGERALESLRTAKSKLDSARAWGIYDMLGGGFLSSMIKHGQIGKANEWMIFLHTPVVCLNAKRIRQGIFKLPWNFMLSMFFQQLKRGCLL